MGIERIEANMETKDQKMAAMEVEIEAKDVRIAALEVEMESKDQRIATLEEEMERLRGRMTETEETDIQLREMVDQVRNPPFAFQCAWADFVNSDNSIITYDWLTYDDISGGTIYNV